MKKAMLLSLTLSALLMFSGCATATASNEREQEPMEQVEVVEPVTAEPESEPAATEPQAEPVSAAQNMEYASGELLDSYFNWAYTAWTPDRLGSPAGIDESEKEYLELLLLSAISNYPDIYDASKPLPPNYEELYHAWRAAQQQNTVEIAPVEEAEAIPFNAVSETVYATQNVNIRASWSADSEKLGTLSYGASLTRTGIGTEDASNWSRVEYNGMVVYVYSAYLSTTRPAPQSQTQPSQSTPAQSSQSTTPSQPSSTNTNPNYSSAYAQYGGTYEDYINWIYEREGGEYSKERLRELYPDYTQLTVDPNSGKTASSWTQG